MCFCFVLEVKTECAFAYIGSFSVSHNRKIKNRKKSVLDKQKRVYVLCMVYIWCARCEHAWFHTTNLWSVELFVAFVTGTFFLDFGQNYCKRKYTKHTRDMNIKTNNRRDLYMYREKETGYMLTSQQVWVIQVWQSAAKKKGHGTPPLFFSFSNIPIEELRTFLQCLSINPRCAYNALLGVHLPWR